MISERKLESVETPTPHQGFLGAGHIARALIRNDFEKTDPFIIRRSSCRRVIPSVLRILTLVWKPYHLSSTANWVKDPTRWRPGTLN